MKIYVDLDIEQHLYIKPSYIYLHFFIFNLSMEIIQLIEEKSQLFKLEKDTVNQFRVLLYLYGFKYFEFDKQRRSITNKVTLSETEQTLINCVEMISKDKLKQPTLVGMPTIKTKKTKDYRTFVDNIGSKYSDSLVIINNIKHLLIYLIESEINNLRYWNSPSTFHKQDKNLVMLYAYCYF